MEIIIVRDLKSSRVDRILNFLLDLKSEFEGDHIDKLKQYREPAAEDIFGSGKYKLLQPVPVTPRERHAPPKLIKPKFAKVPKVSDFHGQGHGQHGI